MRVGGSIHVPQGSATLEHIMSDDEVTAKVRKRRKPLAVGQVRNPHGKASIDWTSMKAEYISAPTRIEYEVLAKKYGTTRIVVARRAQEEDWKSAREIACDEVVSRSTRESIENRVARLAIWNEESILEAGWLREAARKLYMRHTEEGWKFNKDIDHKSISAAAAAHVAADKLARLALGASTDNLNQQHSTLPASVDDFV